MKIRNFSLIFAFFFVLFSVSAFAQVAITPANPDTNSLLTCDVTSGNPNSYTYKWYLGTNQYNGAYIYASQTTRGQTWTCVVYNPVSRTSGVTEKGRASVTISNTPPIVNANGPYAGIEGVPVSFSGTASDPADVDPITSYSWNFGDGQTSNLQNPTHVYAQNGAYTVRLTATDAGGASTTSAPVTATIADTNPVSNAGPDQTVVEGSLVTFNGALSTAYDMPLTYSWRFSNGTVFGNTVNPTYTFTQNGTYTITLTVTDNDGSAANDNVVITVTDTVPTANFSASSYNVLANQTVNFTDLSTFVVDAITSWLWDFGDSTTSILQNPSYGYPAAGSFLVNLTVTDSDGSTSSLARTVTVTLVPDTFAPATVANLYSSNQTNTTITWNWTNPIDPDFAGVNVLIDGFNLVNLSSPDSGYVGTFLPNTTHTITLYTKDSLGNLNTTGVSDTNKTLDNVFVPPPAPGAPNITSISPLSPVNVNISDLVNFNISAVDPEGSNLTVNWTVSDGFSYLETILSGAFSNITHAFANNGTFTVNVIVTDNQTLSANYLWTVNVTNSTVIPPSPNAPNITFTTPASPVNINISDSVNFDITAVDPENSNLTVNWTLNGVQVYLATITSGSNANYSRLFPANGTFTIGVEVTDNQTLTDFFSWIVNVVNNTAAVPPSINYTINMSSLENNSLSFNLGTISFNSVTGFVLNTVTNGTYAINFTPASGYNFSSWTATPGIVIANTGDPNTLATVNSNGTITAIYANNTVIVPPVNNPPVLNTIGNQTVFENSTLSFVVNATDADVNDTLTFTAGPLPVGATFAGQTFSWTPSLTQSGNYTVTFNVTDGQAIDSETINVQVTNFLVPIHDVRINTGLQNSVGTGVRLAPNSTGGYIFSVPAQLVQDSNYTIDYSINNDGTQIETVNLLVYLDNILIGNHTRTVNTFFTTPVTVFNASLVAPGLHNVRLNVSIIGLPDATPANNYVTRTVNVSLPPDTQIPSVSTVTPITANEDVSVNYFATVSDNVAVTSCSLHVNGANSGLMTLNAGTANGSLMIANPGTYSVLANCTDAAGNFNDTSVTLVTINDVTRPDVTNVLPVSASTFNVGTSIQLSADVVDNVAVNTVYANVTRPGGIITQVPLNLATGNTYNSSYSIPNVTGTYNVRFYARDNAGNVNSTVTTFFVSGDTVLPSVTIVSPTSGTKITSTVLISLTATDNVAVDDVWYRIDSGANVAYTAPVTSPSLSNGVHTLFAFANDTSNNINVSSVTFTIDTTGRVSGTVNNQVTGNPISGATVQIQSTPFSNTTNGVGVYGIAGVSPSTYTLTASAPGYLSQTRTGIVINSNQTTANVDFNLIQAGTIAGRITQFFNPAVGIDGATVTIRQGATVIQTQITAGGGYYTAPNLAPGYYDVYVTAAGYTPNSDPNNQVLSGQTTTVNLYMW